MSLNRWSHYTVKDEALNLVICVVHVSLIIMDKRDIIDNFESLFLEEVNALDSDDVGYQQDTPSTTMVENVTGLMLLPVESQLVRDSERDDEVGDLFNANDDWVQFMQSADAMNSIMREIATSISVEHSQMPAAPVYPHKQSKVAGDAFESGLASSKVDQDKNLNSAVPEIIDSTGESIAEVEVAAEVQAILSDMV